MRNRRAPTTNTAARAASWAFVLFVCWVSLKTLASLPSLHVSQPPLVAAPSVWKPRSPPVIDLYVRTRKADGHWLSFLLRSVSARVDRNAYRNLVITFSPNDTDYFASWLPLVDLPIRMVPVQDVYIRYSINQGGRYAAMVDRLHAFTVSDADYIVHVDSHNIFTKPVTASDFVDDQGRVFVHTLNYTALPEEASYNQGITSALFGEAVDVETATGHPTVYPRDVYGRAIAHAEAKHRKPFLNILRQLDDVTDYSALGHYLVTHMPGRFVEKADKTECMAQKWSHGVLQPAIPALYERKSGEAKWYPGGLSPDIAASYERQIRGGPSKWPKA